LVVHAYCASASGTAVNAKPAININVSLIFNLMPDDIRSPSLVDRMNRQPIDPSMPRSQTLARYALRSAPTLRRFTNFDRRENIEAAIGRASLAAADAPPWQD
jgi:hypothetical protein